MTQTGPLGLVPIRRHLHLIAYTGLAIVLGYALADSPRSDWQILGLVFVIAVGSFLSGQGLDGDTTVISTA